ncbi:hypothetical protein COU37_04410 [Candidatus Micrarchaeota archaeon CG10_big_fil_rev_8_21_14_0_10_45_29]|nr:MAG: hypothetical protein COU37_04410 [Candidatus Micrarchaeota archaeon CG10_big_fil_rev_8_21_14_0_10_45_29]
MKILDQDDAIICKDMASFEILAEIAGWYTKEEKAIAGAPRKTVYSTSLNGAWVSFEQVH